MDSSLRIITEEDLEPVDEDDDLLMAAARLNSLVADFRKKNNGRQPTKAHISDDEELQSFIGLAAIGCGMKFERTTKRTYLE